MLHLDIEGLGTELKLRTFDMTSNTYLREICLKCPEYMGQLMLAGLSLTALTLTSASYGDIHQNLD